jgi:hypothetical protein
MYLASGGNVGIKTTSPTNDLTVKQGSNTQATAGISVVRADTTSHTVLFQGGDDNAYLFNYNGGMQFYTGGSVNALSITSGGNITVSGSISDTAGTRMDAGGGWLRTYGASGWYNQTYGGGWYMQDPTWIRSYASKAVFMSAGFDTGGVSAVGCNGGLGGGYNFRVCGTENVTSSVTAAAFYYASDAQLKKNVEAIASSKALQDILALKPVTFNWIDPNQPTSTQLGFIAQQVEGVVPELVTTNSSTSMKAVDYARVTPLLVGAAQAQQAQIDAQQKAIDALKAEVAALKAGR